MDFSLLKSYVAVAEEKSFSSAAKNLFLSQQTLSKQIAKLEEELGTMLLVRSRPLALTPDGVQFLQTAREILHLKQQYDENSSRSYIGAQHVHLGIEHTIARALLPHVMPAFLHGHPDAFLKLSEESPEILQKSVFYDGVDLAIGSLGSTPDNFEAVPLCRKDQLLVVPRSIFDELAGGRREELLSRFAKGADLRFFASAPFIRIPRQFSAGRALSSYLKYFDLSPRFVCELTNVENAFQLANSGLGVFIYAKVFWDMMAPEAQKAYLNNIYLFPLPHLPEIDDVCAYYNRDVGLHGLTYELFRVIRDFFAAYSAHPGTGKETIQYIYES